jgi:2-oxoglutarate ferredoxin oxidoreductase subunit delta
MTKAGSKGKVEIDRLICKGCRYCIITCLNGVLELDDKFNRDGFFPAVAVNMEKCNGCALCAEMCPDVAIQVWQGKG